MPGIEMKLDKRFVKQAKGVFERYTFDVGVLSDGLHKSALSAKKGLKNIAGGPARKIGLVPTIPISEVSERVRKETGINYLTLPFKQKNSDIIRFTKSFFDLCAGRTVKKRCENLLQAIVRNPIVKRRYGSNSPVTAKIKGFNRLFIDTGQLFKSIRARVNTTNVSKGT